MYWDDKLGEQIKQAHADSETSFSKHQLFSWPVLFLEIIFGIVLNLRHICFFAKMIVMESLILYIFSNSDQHGAAFVKCTVRVWTAWATTWQPAYADTWGMAHERFNVPCAARATSLQPAPTGCRRVARGKLTGVNDLTPVSFATSAVGQSALLATLRSNPTSPLGSNPTSPQRTLRAFFPRRWRVEMKPNSFFSFFFVTFGKPCTTKTFLATFQHPTTNLKQNIF